MRLTRCILAVALATPVMAQTVTVRLTSPQHGRAVRAGQEIQWTITAEVSQGDNAGLALISADLVQDANNPATTDLQPADGVPPAMTNFARPAGITNRGDNDPLLGYLGLQRGPVNGKNLAQVGGAQNNFGVALPSGSGVGENANVEGGVGQTEPVVIASGSFTAPEADGTYRINLANVIANVLTEVNTPPTFSAAVAANVQVEKPTIRFAVFGLDSGRNPVRRSASGGQPAPQP